MSDRERPVSTDGPAPGPRASAFAVAPAPTRRTVLRAAGLAALAGGGVGVLAACSADAGVAAPSAPASVAPSVEATSASPSPSLSASASESASASSAPAAPSGPSVAASKVPVGGGVILQDADFVVTQPSKGTFKAFSSICTHRGCPVTQITGDAIVCPCHGSEFSIEDGSVLQGPATRSLATTGATVSGDSVYVDA